MAYASRSISAILVLVSIHLVSSMLTEPSVQDWQCSLQASSTVSIRFFSSENSSLAAYLRKGTAGETESIDRFHKKIMKTFVLFFFYFKIIVLARRAKRVVMERMERMYAPGGIGFVAAQESFYRAAKSQRIE